MPLVVTITGGTGLIVVGVEGGLGGGLEGGTGGMISRAPGGTEKGRFDLASPTGRSSTRGTPPSSFG